MLVKSQEDTSKASHGCKHQPQRVRNRQKKKPRRDRERKKSICLAHSIPSSLQKNRKEREKRKEGREKGRRVEVYTKRD